MYEALLFYTIIVFTENMYMFVCMRDKYGFKNIYCYASDEWSAKKMSSA